MLSCMMKSPPERHLSAGGVIGGRDPSLRGVAAKPQLASNLTVPEIGASFAGLVKSVI